jgi:hypothetical protein
MNNQFEHTGCELGAMRALNEVFSRPAAQQVQVIGRYSLTT